jgi:signal transduction histidine kinase
VQRSFGFWERFLLKERGPLERYGVAIALSAASLAVAHLLEVAAIRGAGSIALVTVVLSGIYGGLGPALLDGLVTSVGLEYLTEPELSFLDSWDSIIRLVLHAAVAVLIANVTASFRMAYRSLHGKQRETELAIRARENVLNIVSHDLRSPLSVVKLGVDTVRFLAKDGSRPPDLTPLESVDRAADQMQRIINDLLDAARVEKGQFRIEAGWHDLEPLLADAVGSVQALAAARGISLAVSCEESRVFCDRGRVLQVVSNLLHNAVKFSPDGGRVELAARAGRAEMLRVSVRDYGPGMDEHVVARLFERYWQAADTAYRGTGLGLFIARSIAEAHGGRIEVSSSPGAGAVFTLELPVPRGQGGSEQAPPRSKP